MPFQTGDRVRIKNSQCEYTGCRGTIADQPSGEPSSGSVTQLGHLVAIDGENGMTRPFLVADLVPLRAVSVRGQTSAQIATTPRSAGQSAGQSAARSGRNGRSE